MKITNALKHSILSLMLAASALCMVTFDIQAQTFGQFTLTLNGVGGQVATNRYATLDSSSLSCESINSIAVYVSATSSNTVTGNLQWIFLASPDGTNWTSTNDTTFSMLLPLDGASTARKMATFDLTGVKKFKPGLVINTNAGNATNFTVYYYKK